jgi:NitT/TauT family transport system ATP-binding protein
MAMLKVEHISRSFGPLQVLKDFSLEFPEGEITAILGPSGCGKTTLLNIMAGLLEADQGKVGTTDQVSYLFQEPRLLPWLTIEGNITLVLQDKIPNREIRERVNENLEATGLSEYADYYPSQLSGGMLQRAAMARAFSYDAPLLLMDEPFKSLDMKTRYRLIDDFLLLWRRKPRTVIMVTHDVREAVILGAKIVILSEKPPTVLGEYQNKRDSKELLPGDVSDLEVKILRLLLG